MAKKFSMMLAAVALIAFAVPAFASAETPTIWDHGGKLAAGATILGTSTNATTQTSLGLLKCEKVTVTGEVTHNGVPPAPEKTVRGIGKGTSTGTTCSVNNNPIKITNIKLVTIHTAVAGSGTINVTFEADLPAGLVCHFTSEGVPFTYTAGVTNDTLQITNGNLLGTPPACEPGLLSGTFTPETDDGTVPPNPVWIQ